MGGIRIPKDKFMMWISILRKQHKGNENVFLQLAVLGVEFVRQKVSFVSDQFFILAAVGLDAAKVGALIAPEDVETKVASMFVQKFQSSTGNFSTASALAPLPRSNNIRRPTTSKSSDVTVQVDISKHGDFYKPAAITQPNILPGSRPAPVSANNPSTERTRIESQPLPPDLNHNANNQKK